MSAGSVARACHARGRPLLVLVQGKNCFEGLMTLEANIIVDGHDDLPRGILMRELYAPEIVDC